MAGRESHPGGEARRVDGSTTLKGDRTQHLWPARTITNKDGTYNFPNDKSSCVRCGQSCALPPCNRAIADSNKAAALTRCSDIILISPEEYEAPLRDGKAYSSYQDLGAQYFYNRNDGSRTIMVSGHSFRYSAALQSLHGPCLNCGLVWEYYARCPVLPGVLPVLTQDCELEPEDTQEFDDAQASQSSDQLRTQHAQLTLPSDLAHAQVRRAREEEPLLVREGAMYAQPQ